MKFRINIKPKTLKLKDLKKKERNYKSQFIIILISIISLIIFFTGISLGKVMDNVDVNANIEIAKPILEVEKDSEIIITEDNKEGEYKFKIKNYNQLEEISQVNLKYYIEITGTNLDKSIQLNLYKENEKIELNNGKTQDMSLKKDEKQEQNYILKIKYDSTKNDIGDIMQDIYIKVHSEQFKI